MFSLKNFLSATSTFSHFSSASVWALPKGLSSFRLPAVLVWTFCRLLGKYLLCYGDLFLLSSDLGVPSVISHSTLCSLLLLAFPFVWHVFCECLSSWLQGSVMPQGWSMGPAGMGDVQQPQASLHGGCPCSSLLPMPLCHRQTMQ